jgi:tetratricopeptide (TPR) repeat protein
LGAVALLAALWWARLRLGRAPLTAMIYFALAFPALVMVEMLYMMRYSFVSDHWQYLGSMGVIPIGVSATVAALNRWKLDLSKLGFVIGTIVLAGLGFLTWQQGHIYRDLETFWRDTLAKNPGAWIAHYNLANTLARQSKTSEAMAEYKTTLRLKPDYAEAHNNLGVALASQGRIEEAIAEYAAALRIRPYAEARYNWGVDLASQGKIEEAMAQYREALRLRPDWPPALSRLAWILATDRNAGLRNGGEAVPLAERLCAVTGYDRSDALDVLAAAYAEAGRFGEALRAAQKAIELEGATGQTKLAQQIQGRLTLYQTGHPFHEN